MAKTLVIEPGEDHTKIPFLRGILTRSLQDAGLSFDEAYALASTLREELAETPEITTPDLHEAVVRHLSAEYGTAVVQRYEALGATPHTVLVRDIAGRTTPFSREQHRRLLESSGLSYERSTAVTTAIFDHLMKKAVAEITARHLGVLTFRYVRRALGAGAARRYLVLADYFHGGRPLLVLIGGAPGSGKSVVATEVAHRLGIVRTQSTDLLREVMRMMIPQRLSPVLHTSSFDAWRALPGRGERANDTDATVLDGYRAQAELLSVPCEAVIKRALREQVSLLLEGVHVQHTLLDRIPVESGAIVVPIMLAVLNPERLKAGIRGRGKHADQRRAERYLEHFDGIWQLQSFLLSEADRWGIRIVVNDYKDQVINEILRIVVDALSADFAKRPEEVFA
ncbi:MAG: zeta toxin family protein [Alphaproteobacteria bacterium]|nr:zeta toxin family protein [Alphaproteobacteria bacterium]